MIKYIYIIFIVLYIGMMVVWSMRYPLSHKIVGVKPDLIEERSLTQQEYKGLKKAVIIRQWCGTVLLYSSLFVLLMSIFLLRNRWFEPTIIVKVVMIVAGIMALILILASGIHFIPGPPIR